MAMFQDEEMECYGERFVALRSMAEKQSPVHSGIKQM